MKINTLEQISCLTAPLTLGPSKRITHQRLIVYPCLIFFFLVILAKHVILLESKIVPRIDNPPIFPQTNENITTTTTQEQQPTPKSAQEQSNNNVTDMSWCTVDSFDNGDWQHFANSSTVPNKNHTIWRFRNLSCPFENLAHSCDRSQQYEKANYWAQTFWIPHQKCRKRPFEHLFPVMGSTHEDNNTYNNNKTVVILGDSLGRQTFVALACSLYSTASEDIELVSYDVDWMDAKEWCDTKNWCYTNVRSDNSYNGFLHAKALFRLRTNDQHEHQRSAVFNLQYIDSITLRSKGRSFVPSWLSTLPAHTVVVFSDGIRGKPAIRHLKNLIFTHIVGDNLHVRTELSFVYLETIAPHFPTPYGIYHQRWKRSLGCTDLINTSLAYEMSPNPFAESFLKDVNIPILKIWNATVKAGPTAHVGLGIDCVHYCNPGVPVFFAELLTHFLVEEWYKRNWII